MPTLDWDFKNSMQGYWKLDDNASSPVITDSLGNNDGNMYLGATLGAAALENTAGKSVDGVIDRALHFNTGNNEWVRINYLPKPTSFPLTLTGWFRCSGNFSRCIFSIGDLGETNQYLHCLNVTTGQLRISHFNTTSVGGNSSTLYNDGKWHFVVACWESTDLRRIHIDGFKEIVTVEGNKNLIADMNNIAIGGVLRSNTILQSFEGDIDNVMFFNKVLSNDEIIALYNYGYGIDSLTGSIQYAEVRFGNDSIYGIRGNSSVVVQDDVFRGDPVTITTSYTNNTYIAEEEESEIMIAGVPLSISRFNDNGHKMEDGSVTNTYWAFDIIEHIEDPDEYYEGNLINPGENFFIYQGTKFKRNRIDNRYYWEIASIGDNILPSRKTTVEGVPMLVGNYNELVLHKTDHTFEDVLLPNPSDLPNMINIPFGGSYISAGRIDSKYYLIVNPR